MTQHTPETLPHVDPMFVRTFVPVRGSKFDLVRDVLVFSEVNVEDVGLVESRLAFDDDVVDCSYRVFDITTAMIVDPSIPSLFAFPSRRWRRGREGNRIVELPTIAEPLLYIGNPVRVLRTTDGLTVVRLPEFLIRSGPEIEYRGMS